jgi:hypothetical protein
MSKFIFRIYIYIILFNHRHHHHHHHRRRRHHQHHHHHLYRHQHSVSLTQAGEVYYAKHQVSSSAGPRTPSKSRYGSHPLMQPWTIGTCSMISTDIKTSQKKRLLNFQFPTSVHGDTLFEDWSHQDTQDMSVWHDISVVQPDWLDWDVLCDSKCLRKAPCLALEAKVIARHHGHVGSLPNVQTAMTILGSWWFLTFQIVSWKMALVQFPEAPSSPTMGTRLKDHTPPLQLHTLVIATRTRPSQRIWYCKDLPGAKTLPAWNNHVAVAAVIYSKLGLLLGVGLAPDSTISM